MGAWGALWAVLHNKRRVQLHIATCVHGSAESTEKMFRPTPIVTWPRAIHQLQFRQLLRCFHTKLMYYSGQFCFY